MIWFTEDMKHFKTTRYALHNRKFVTTKKARRHADFFVRHLDLWYVPMGTARRKMKYKRGISKGRGIIGYV